MPTYRSISGSSAENLFIELFSDTFGAEKADYLYPQYPFSDIYQNSRFVDFMIENGGHRVAIEIDDEASHNPRLVSQNKFYDDLLKQNSMIYLGWDVYRWAVRQMQQQPETVKDELRIFLGRHPSFKEIEDYLPTQRGKSLDGSRLELKEHQKQALAALEETFRELWPQATVGRYVESAKEKDTFVVCGSIQSVALNLEQFKPDDFGYIIVDEAHHASADTYQKVLAYFTPEFTLGLIATPERADDKNILDIFKHTAHKLDIQTAVEIGELVPVRCIRIHTNIDLTKVRFNSIQYNIRDLESKIYVPERNQLIVDTWLQYVKDKRTVIFCASVRHAKEIAGRLHDAGVAAQYLVKSKQPTGGKFWPALKRDKQRSCVPVTCSTRAGTARPPKCSSWPGPLCPRCSTPSNWAAACGCRPARKA